MDHGPGRIIVAVLIYLVAKLMKQMNDEERLELLSYLSWEDIQRWRKTFNDTNDWELMNQATTLGRRGYDLKVTDSEPWPPSFENQASPSEAPSSSSSAVRYREPTAGEDGDWEKELEELRRLLRGSRKSP